MSSVRMCDKCARIFSENEEDWSTFSGTRQRRDQQSGRKFAETVVQDACPECTNGSAPVRPQLTPPPGDRIAELERGEILDRLQAVERTAGLGVTHDDEHG